MGLIRRDSKPTKIWQKIIATGPYNNWFELIPAAILRRKRQKQDNWEKTYWIAIMINIRCSYYSFWLFWNVNTSKTCVWLCLPKEFSDLRKNKKMFSKTEKIYRSRISVIKQINIKLDNNTLKDVAAII